jgi:hypothetical protein
VPEGRELTLAEVLAIIQRAGDLAARIVLIGGQATAFWAAQFEDAELRSLGAVTSKDLDFCGLPSQVREFAARVGGTYRLPTLDDATPNTGLVEIADSAGRAQRIDFIGDPFGLNFDDVVRLAVPVELPAGDSGGGLRLLVMHPLHCLESRVANASGLGRTSPTSMRQLRAAIICLRSYLRGRLELGAVRAVLDLNERLFWFALSRHGRAVFERHGIDPFDGALLDPRLPAMFIAKRLPQMRARLDMRAQPSTQGEVEI